MIVNLSVILAMDNNRDISKLQIYPKIVFNKGISTNTINTMIETKINCRKGITIRFVIRKNIGNRPKLIRIIGKVNTWADVVVIALDNKDLSNEFSVFRRSLKKFFIYGDKLTIPNTARNDNWKEILNNTNGSKQRKIKAVTNKIFVLSPLREVNFDNVSKEIIVATINKWS